jgi:Ca2+/Na+ antiporter
MGVSNTFGSNVFDLLVGLALPWFFKVLISGEAVHINSNGLMYDSILLLGIVGVTVSYIKSNELLLQSITLNCL